MLVAFIILVIAVAIIAVVFGARVAKINESIDGILSNQSMLHGKYCGHEDRIDANYRSLSELNRRQDEWARQHRESDTAMREEVASLRERVERLEQQPEPIVKIHAAAMERREQFATLRETLSVREAAKEMGVSLTTAKRYEKWRKANECE